MPSDQLRPGPIASGTNVSEEALRSERWLVIRRSLIVELSFGTLNGLVARAVVLGVAAALAFGNDVFVMDGSDVMGIDAGYLG